MAIATLVGGRAQHPAVALIGAPHRRPTPLRSRRRDGARHAERAAGAVGGLRRHRAVRPDGARRREVIWTRILSLLFGATVYTFSLILAVFLVGLGIGSSDRLGAGRAHARRPRRRARLVPDAAVRRDGLGGVHATRDRCRTGRSTRRSPADPWYTFQLDLVRCLLGRPAGAILWGASFPLALAAVAVERPGSGAAGRRRVRGQHRRRDRRRRSAPACCWSPWLGSAALAAGADRRSPALSALLLLEPLAVRRTGSTDGEALDWAGTTPMCRRLVVAGLLARSVPPIAGDPRRLRPLCRHAARARPTSSTWVKG